MNYRIPWDLLTSFLLLDGFTLEEIKELAERFPSARILLSAEDGQEILYIHSVVKDPETQKVMVRLIAHPELCGKPLPEEYEFLEIPISEITDQGSIPVQ